MRETAGWQSTTSVKPTISSQATSSKATMMQRHNGTDNTTTMIPIGTTRISQTINSHKFSSNINWLYRQCQQERKNNHQRSTSWQRSAWTMPTLLTQASNNPLQSQDKQSRPPTLWLIVVQPHMPAHYGLRTTIQFTHWSQDKDHNWEQQQTSQSTSMEWDACTWSHNNQ